MNKELEGRLYFLKEVDSLKNVIRQNKLVDASRYENVAEHSWHFALSAMTLFDYCVLPNVDLNKVIKMALVHDLVEIYAGDTPAYADVAKVDTSAQEEEAAKKLFSMLPQEQGQDYLDLWLEFEAKETNDSLYANANDRFQAAYVSYLSGNENWKNQSVTKEKFLNRMGIVESVMPDLWPYVLFILQEAIDRGTVSE